jgi:hypothetical protein
MSMAPAFSYGQIEYEDVRAIDRNNFADKALKPDAWKPVAAKVQICPMTVQEIDLACRHYPIVFSPGDSPTAVAVLSFTPGMNPFADAETGWKVNHYIPAAIRRYPFIFGELQDVKERPLCVDLAATEDAEAGTPGRLFEDGEKTEIVDRALKICEAYQMEVAKTEAVIKRLLEAELLVERSLKITTKGGEERQTGAFRMVDDDKLRELPDETVLDFHKRGLMRVIHAHQISLRNIEAVASMS